MHDSLHLTNKKNWIHWLELCFWSRHLELVALNGRLRAAIAVEDFVLAEKLQQEINGKTKREATDKPKQQLSFQQV